MKITDLHSPERNAQRKLAAMGGNDFDKMRMYVQSLQQLLKREQFKILNDYKAELEAFPDSTPFFINMRDEVYLKRLDDNENRFTGYLLNSALVASASLFEAMLKQVCHFAAYKTQHPFDEPRQQVLIRCKEYVQKLKIGVEEIEEHWEKIQLILSVRHLITHQGAMLIIGLIIGLIM